MPEIILTLQRNKRRAKLTNTLIIICITIIEGYILQRFKFFQFLPTSNNNNNNNNDNDDYNNGDDNNNNNL